MKPNKLTPGSNLRWKSSTMMLPEHMAAHVAHRSSLNIRTKPTLDDQELQEISNAVYSSLMQRTFISLILYGQYENRTVTGIVSRMDAIHHQIRVDGEWIKQEDILGYTL